MNKFSILGISFLGGVVFSIGMKVGELAIQYVESGKAKEHFLKVADKTISICKNASENVVNVSK